MNVVTLLTLRTVATSSCNLTVYTNTRWRCLYKMHQLGFLEHGQFRWFFGHLIQSINQSINKFIQRRGTMFL